MSKLKESIIAIICIILFFVIASWMSTTGHHNPDLGPQYVPTQQQKDYYADQYHERMNQNKREATGFTLPDED